MTTTVRRFSVPTHQLFTVVVDPQTYPKWLVGTKHIRTVDPTWPAPGSTFRHVVGFGPLAVPDTTTSVSVKPDHSLELIVRARPFVKAGVRFDIAGDGGGCTLTMQEDPIGIFRFLAAVEAPLIRARNERSFDRLEKVVRTYTWPDAPLACTATPGR